MPKRSPQPVEERRRVPREEPDSPIRYDVMILVSEAYEEDLPAVRDLLQGLMAKRLELSDRLVYLNPAG